MRECIVPTPEEAAPIVRSNPVSQKDRERERGVWMRTMGSVIGEGGSADQAKELNVTERNGVSEGGEVNGSEWKNLEIESGGGVVVSLGGNQETKGKEKAVYGGSSGDGGEFDDGDCEKLGKVGDDEAEEDEEQAEEGDEEEEEGVSGAGRPKLDEGFYEIEAVRRKRARKGVVQYLIKWRDWPETANTWEPVENLQSCSDVIEAFEERLSSGKGSHRRRKRKSGVIHAQIRRKQPRSSGTSTKRSGRARNVANSPVTSAPTEDTSLAENPSSSEYNISVVDNKHSSENDVAVNSEVQLNQDIDCDLNMKLTEFRGGVSNDDTRTDNLMMIPSQVDNGPRTQESGRVDTIETTPSNLPITGSKKRKSGKVRRHIPDPNSDNIPDVVFDPVPGLEVALVHENLRSPIFPATNHKITAIMKPLSYARPESSIVHDPVVTFLAMRSDGKQVLVDNKFMKAYYPQQLISFYEKNIRYNPIS